jgi:hypothetical protein
MKSIHTSSKIAIGIAFIAILFSIAIWISYSKSTESMDAGTSYSANLLTLLAPIVYDSSQLSNDKIDAIRKINPPITDPTISQYLNAGGDADTVISNIKTYLGSCPSAPSPLPSNPFAKLS